MSRRASRLPAAEEAQRTQRAASEIIREARALLEPLRRGEDHAEIVRAIEALNEADAALREIEAKRPAT